MRRSKRLIRYKRHGYTLLLSIIFIALFSALGTALATFSSSNIQIAHNQQEAGQALSSAHSGLEVVRYYLQNVGISASVAPADRLETLATKLQTAFYNAGASNMTASYNSGTQTLSISNVTLNSQTNESFAAEVTYGGDYDTLNIVITGSCQQLDRKVGVFYEFTEIGNPIFDFGIATKGPLSMQGNVDVDGFNENIEASVYIESMTATLALEMTGKSSIAGEVTIGNGGACVDISNQSSVCGEEGSDALDHVTIGAGTCDFPVMSPTDFEHYTTGNVFDPNTDPTSNVTLTNIQIPQNTNPSFSGHAIIRGVMYIKAPNVVTFTGNAEIHGLIVAEGDVDNPSESNVLDFGGTVDSYDVSTLPEEEFGSLTEETGTFILAPGFSTCFRGNFGTLNGVIASSGVEFQGNAGGTINGSVINYSGGCMTLDGNTDLVFNRSGVQKVPAGFEPSTTLAFVTNSYYEPM